MAAVNGSTYLVGERQVETGRPGGASGERTDGRGRGAAGAELPGVRQRWRTRD